jgi:dihydroorotate dehydrogenase electron transfer subunit
MIWLARALSSRGCDVLSFCGARTRRLLALSLIGEPSASAAEPRMAAEEFASSRTPVVLATDDGSLGVKGRVSTAMEDYHSAHPCPSDELIVYTCGPEPMMRSVARWCHDRGIACQVCMERMMGCGIGTCQSCVVAIRDPSAPRGFVYKLCCKDGPVFDAETVDWSQAVPRSVYTPPY